MKTIAPDYFFDFKCISSECKHTCCGGWVIVIDRETKEIYDSTEGPLGDSLRANTELYDEENDDYYARISLDENGFCPFLRGDNLCQLVVEKGQGFLCEVCTSYPRFTNRWSDRNEMGLGMSCEEAARIILTRQSPMKLVTLEDDGVKEELTPEEQRLMELRNELLDSVLTHKYRHPAEQRLLEYLIWHHVANSKFDDRLEDRALFIKKAFNKITARWHIGNFPDIDELIELARSFSRSIEHGTNFLDDI